MDPFDMVRAWSEEVLRRSGVKGTIPTPLHEVARWVDIREVLDIGEFNNVLRDEHRRRRSPGAVLKRFVGAVFFDPKVVLVDTSKPEEMQRWTEAHELAHKLLPWHVESSYRDDDLTLSRETKEQMEREASAGGAHLLFQGSHFWDESLSYKQGLAVPVALARSYGASLTATIRYYVETHHAPVGLLCASQYVQNRSRRIAYSQQSSAFEARFGPVAGLFPNRLPVDGQTLPPSVSIAVHDASNSRSIGHGEMHCMDLNGELVELNVETFYNGYNLFLLVIPHRRVSLGRRLLVGAPKAQPTLTERNSPPASCRS
jgi:hypothetical protein